MRTPRHARIALAATAGVLACVSLQWEPMGPRRTAPIEGAEIVGTEECGVCHEDVQGHEKIAGYHAVCESCHGGGSLHAETEAVADIRHPSNADCLSCHRPSRNTHLEWGSGEHSRAGLLCSDCHNPHDVSKRHLREPRRAFFREMDAASGLCLQCHEAVAARLDYPSHHPVAEGAMSCMSCHDPHEDRRISGGERTQLCAGCHQDFVGPWIFEHPPVVDDCAICHNPHGGVTDDLLEPLMPVVCLGCHTVNDMFHHVQSATGIPGASAGSPIESCGPGQSDAACRDGRSREAGTFLDRCTDCHGAIHGSYTDEHLRH